MELLESKQNDTVVFWCEHYFQLYFLLPCIQEKASSGCKILLYVQKKEDLSVVDLPESVQICYIDSLKNRYISRIDYIFKKYLVPVSFSETYYRKFFKDPPSRFFRIINKAFSFKRNYNSRYVNFFSFLHRVGLIRGIPISFDELHVCTKVFYSYLLAPYSDKMISYMESWDHPQKGPYFIQPKVHYTWNDELREETLQYQPDIGPVKLLNRIEKFRYTGEFFHEKVDDDRLAEEITWFQDNAGRYVVYPVCLSSTFHNVQPDEKEFISELAKVLLDTNLILYVRPYPLAPRRDVEGLNASNLKIGCLAELPLGAEVFSTDAAIHKIKLIENAHTVLNVGTTFILDAAYFSTPLLQINLADDIGRFAEVSSYKHIKKYLNKGVPKTGRKELPALAKQILQKDKSHLEKLRLFLRIAEN